MSIDPLCQTDRAIEIKLIQVYAYEVFLWVRGKKANLWIPQDVSFSDISFINLKNKLFLFCFVFFLDIEFPPFISSPCTFLLLHMIILRTHRVQIQRQNAEQAFFQVLDLKATPAEFQPCDGC